MAIRPTDIRRKEFKNSLRGYDANQVDDFLDEVAEELENANSENSRLREESSSLRSRLEQFDELEGSIRAALVHAEQAANDLRRTATQEAESARHTASREAELTINEAKARAHRMLADTSERVERVQESYEALRNARQLFASDFRHLLKSYLEVMDNADVASAREIEASLRERVDFESIAAARMAAESENAGLQEELPVEEPAAETSDDSTYEHETLEETSAFAQDTHHTDEDAPAGEESIEEEPVVEGVSGEGAPVSVGDDPEVEEPEVEPSTAEDSASEEREESTLARESGSHEFWEGAEKKSASGSGEEDSRVFRASRFLRRRG
ncbi:MAG: DivIVA domain-containing protein [Rubrobacteraceae bacterium]